MINYFKNKIIKNTKNRSKENIAKHYDLGNDFFSLWLDETLTYSSAIFDNSKIKSFVPDFKAIIPFKEGIKETINWFESDPKRMIIDNETNEMIDEIITKYER